MSTDKELALGLPTANALAAQSLKAILENYLRYYGSGDNHTARAKRYDLNHFLEFLAESQQSVDVVTVSDWTTQSTKDFIDSRLEQGEAPATVARRLATLKHLGRTLAERVNGFINPAREVKGPVLQLPRPHGLAEKEVSLLREAANDAASKGDFINERNSFLLELLLSTGLRADEVRLLTLGQISEDKSWLKNVKTKGRKFRKVYLDSEIREKLINYLEIRNRELQKRFGELQATQARFPLLVSFYGVSCSNPTSFGLSPKTIWRIIASFGKKAQALSEETFGNLHPHRLRHTFAHGLLESSRDVRLVAQALGHSDVRTTMRYTERSDQEIALAIEEKNMRRRGA